MRSARLRFCSFIDQPDSLPCLLVVGNGDAAPGVHSVGLGTALPHLQMQVVSGGIAGGAHITDQFALLHILARTGSHRAHVRVQGGIGIAIGHFAVVDDNVVAIAAGRPASHLHIAAGGCVDRRASR